MVPPKSKGQAGLGRSLINKRASVNRQGRDPEGITVLRESSAKLRSVTQEPDLDEFLNIAQLAAKDFTAEKQNLRIIHTPTIGVKGSSNPFLLSTDEEKDTVKRHWELRSRLRVPRRPAWDKSMDRAQLEQRERESFLEWRRQLAGLQESEGLLLTPFERNLEVWRQLWRVIERSQLVVQIVDGRNPLQFRCRDLELYVSELGTSPDRSGINGSQRKLLLLINKSDLLDEHQRTQWADYFDTEKINYVFFSALKPSPYSPPISPLTSDAEEDPEGHLEQTLPLHSSSPTVNSHAGKKEVIHSDHDSPTPGGHPEADSVKSGSGIENPDLRIQILSVSELEILFLKLAPNVPDANHSSGTPSSKPVVGLVGYPNVGKSSTINALLGETKVSVSSTPGKTKHFQTIHLASGIVLCDCPGLVFPQFATTKAELVCNGVLPIDQMREYTGPVDLVKRRIPKEILELSYGLVIEQQQGEGDELLVAYAVARGFTRSTFGTPDEARAARYILKDYVNAKLLFCHPPPGMDPDAFNRQTHENTLRGLRETGRKKAPLTRVPRDASTSVVQRAERSNPASVLTEYLESGASLQNLQQPIGPFVQAPQRPRQDYARSKAYPHQNILHNNGTQVQDHDGGSGDNEMHFRGKRHHKKPRK
ncbi:hypothetical protein FRC02_008130 [Tulasnella sp. 418]|nr:hypothetical protein FRC02_008130 [Tulasnella sp. 418]